MDWILKTEPDVYSIDHLAKDRQCDWDGIRNYRARNFLRDEAEAGDQAFIYHSSCAKPGIVGMARLISGAETDPTQFDAKSDYFDPKASPESPRWVRVRLRFEKRALELIPPARLKAAGLGELLLFKQTRLSVIPLEKSQSRTILGLKGAW